MFGRLAGFPVLMPFFGYRFKGHGISLLFRLAFSHWVDARS